jgi:hypothetical protein
MGLKIKYWTSAPIDETGAPVEKVKGRKTRKVPAKSVSRWNEVTVDVTSFGVTQEFWSDHNNQDAVEAILAKVPGINTDFGVSSVKY